MIYRKVVKRVNPKTSYDKKTTFFPFSFPSFFLLYLYVKMDVRWNYFSNNICKWNHLAVYLNLYSDGCQLFPNKTGEKKIREWKLSAKSSKRTKGCFCASRVFCGLHYRVRTLRNVLRGYQKKKGLGISYLETGVKANWGEALRQVGLVDDGGLWRGQMPGWGRQTPGKSR